MQTVDLLKQAAQRLFRTRQIFAISNGSCAGLKRLLHFLPGLRKEFPAAFATEHGQNIFFFRIFGAFQALGIGGGASSGPAAENQRFQSRVPADAIGSVQAARYLAAGIKTFQSGTPFSSICTPPSDV